MRTLSLSPFFFGEATALLFHLVRRLPDCVMTSPMRPIACESELIMLIAPMSCRISSAAPARMRLSANATSSAGWDRGDADHEHVEMLINR